MSLAICIHDVHKQITALFIFSCESWIMREHGKLGHVLTPGAAYEARQIDKFSASRANCPKVNASSLQN